MGFALKEEKTIQYRYKVLITATGCNNCNFAKMIRMSTTTIQNIVGGRKTKPSFDTLNNTLKQRFFINGHRLVRIRPAWLILGEGDIFETIFDDRDHE